MGLQESKQKSQQMTTSVLKMKRDIRNGKISDSSTIAKCRSILERYLLDLEEKLAPRLRPQEVNKLQTLIFSTLNQLEEVRVREEDLDLRAVSTDSFSRLSSRRNSKEKVKPVKAIIDSTQEIRHLIRSEQISKEDYDKLQRELARQSQRLSSMAKKYKKHEVDAAQKLISSVTEELFTKQEKSEDNTDAGSVKSTAPSTPVLEKPTVPEIANKNNTGSLDDIENKLEMLKNEINVAEANKDKNRLHFLSKSVQTLITDLQQVDVTDHILSEERKGLLESNLLKTQQEADKIRKQLAAESELENQTKQQKKLQQEKTLQELEDIEDTLVAITRNLTQQNFRTEKEVFNNYKNRLNSIEEISQEVSFKKGEVFDVALNVENAFTKLEMEERLNEAEWKHYQYRIDLDQFTETTKSEGYKKRRQYLLELRDYVNQVLEVSQKIDEKKKYVLYNINNNIAALEKKATENEEESKDKVIYRRNVSNQNLVDNLVASFKEFEQSFSGNCNLSELKKIHNQLEDLRVALEDRIRALEYQILNDDPRLVTVKEKHIGDVQNSIPPAHHLMENIQKDLEVLQARIEDSRYTRDSQLYKDIQNQLEGYKNEVNRLIQDNEDNRRMGENILNQAENISVLLDSNLASRKSTTEDILIDIMSISTRVNDLGSKIHSFNQDHESIRTKLQEHQQYLKNLQIGPSRTNLFKSRDEVLLQIERYLTEMDNLKKNQHSSAASEEEKLFREELKKLKEKVSRYSGTYRNVLYRSIENDLNKCLNKVDKVFKDKNVASKVRRDVENHKMILEQKSIKDRRYSDFKETVRDHGNKELTEIKENIDSVKRELTKPKRLSKEELDKLDAKLTLSILALDNIKDEQLNEEKNKLYQDIHLYFRRIQELMVIKPVITEDVVENQFNKQQMAAETIARVEKKLEEIRPEILTFVGLETGDKFFELDEALIGSTLKLDGLKVDKNGELQLMKTRLLREINKYNDILEARVRQTEEMEALEKEVKEMLIKIDSFNGYFGDQEYSFLDEQIIRLKVTLGKMEANQQLQARKEACIREIDACMKKLNESAKPTIDSVSGTLV